MGSNGWSKERKIAFMPSQDHVSLLTNKLNWARNGVAGQRVVGVRASRHAEGMQTARLLGTHRVGTISLPNHQFLNPSFYRSGHTLSSRGFLAGRWACLYHIGQPPLAYSLHYTFPTPLALTFKASLGADRWTEYAYSRGVVYEVGYLYFAGGRRRECLFVCRKSAIRYSVWGIVMLFKRDSREGMVS